MRQQEPTRARGWHAAVATALAVGMLLTLSLAPGSLGAAETGSGKKAQETQGGLIATASQCPGSTSIVAKLGKREQAMYCMIAHARRHLHRNKILRSRRLTKTGRLRTMLMVRCGYVTAIPCGKSFYWFYEQSGYSTGQSAWDAFPMVTAVENFGNYKPVATTAMVFQLFLHYYDYVILSNKSEHVGVDVRQTRESILVWSLEFGKGGRR